MSAAPSNSTLQSEEIIMSHDSTQTPDTQDGNPFSLLAYVLFKVRHALEDRAEPNRPPRWVRIARGGAYKDDIPLGPIVSSTVNGLAETLSYMAELVLDIEELLHQTDAAKAIGEVTLQLIQAATDDAFQSGIEALAGTTTLGELNQVMEDINNAATNIEPYLHYIPDPEDVHGLGHELYRLLCIEQQPFPRTASNAIDTTSEALRGTDHLIMESCGKVRLCAWAYAHGVTAHGLGEGESGKQELSVLGARRLYATASNAELPPRSAMTWTENDDAARIFAFDFPSNDPALGARDLHELVALLAKHGYSTGDPADAGAEVLTSTIRTALMELQAINDLPITGEVDTHTLNRLMNLDFARKNLRRARPHDPAFPFPWPAQSGAPAAPLSGELQVVNAGAEQPEDEGLAPVQRLPHPYYTVPATPGDLSPVDVDNWPTGRGWIRDQGAGVIPGFVVLRSRARNLVEGQPGRFAGGLWSEGEAAGGRFFWAARHTEPWRDARMGQHGADALFGSTPPAPGSISRMYQWIPLPSWLDPSDTANTPDGAPDWELHVYASVLQRSLFADRGGNSFPDQGRIQLELYGSDVFTAEDTTTSARDPGKALGRASTALFPDHAATTAAMSLDEVDRKRLWIHRVTAPMTVPPGTVALCLMAEGVHQSAHDIDAYFDDFRVGYAWKRPEDA